MPKTLTQFELNFVYYKYFLYLTKISNFIIKEPKNSFFPFKFNKNFNKHLHVNIKLLLLKSIYLTHFSKF